MKHQLELQLAILGSIIVIAGAVMKIYHIVGGTGMMAFGFIIELVALVVFVRSRMSN
ncbi:MAG: hypothetical protein WBG46_09810 [Nonlabens sp.]